MLGRYKKGEKQQKGSNFVRDGKTNEDNNFTKVKDAKFPNLVNQWGIIDLSHRTGESLLQASEVIEVGPGVMGPNVNYRTYLIGMKIFVFIIFPNMVTLSTIYMVKYDSIFFNFGLQNHPEVW